MTPLADVTTGMWLNEDVLDQAGHTLLKAGIALTAHHLTLLRAHGVLTVRTRAPEAAAAAANPPDHRGQLFHNLDPDHPLTQELKRIHCQRSQLTAEETGI